MNSKNSIKSLDENQINNSLSVINEINLDALGF